AHIVLRIHLAEQLGLERGMVCQQDIKFGLGEYRHRQSLEWRWKRWAVGTASLQRQPLGLGEFRQPLPDRNLAGRSVEQRGYHRFGFSGVEVEDQGLDRTVGGGGKRQRAVAERDQRQ